MYFWVTNTPGSTAHPPPNGLRFFSISAYVYQQDDSLGRFLLIKRES